MSDLIERLKDKNYPWPDALRHEAAARIKELEHWLECECRRADDACAELRSETDAMNARIAELEEAAKAPLPSPGAAAAETVCHDEQLEIWADEFTMHLHAAASDFIPDFETYGIKIMYFSAIKDAIRDVVGKAFNHPELAKAPLPEEVAGRAGYLRTLAGQLRTAGKPLTAEECDKAAATLERMARLIEMQKNANNISIEHYRARIAELEADLQQHAELNVAEHKFMLQYRAERDAIEAATIEKCAQALDNAASRGETALIVAIYGCAASIIRALAKPPEKEEK